MIEALLISGVISQFLIPALGVIITGLVGWGVKTLQKKTNSDLAKNALDQVDQIVGTVVGSIAQTTAKTMKAATKDGHFSDLEKKQLRAGAQAQIMTLLPRELIKAVEKSINNPGSYVKNKIEERVLAGKAPVPVMPLAPMKKVTITLPTKKKAKK